MTSGLTARQIRERLTHPIVDCDGHWVESMPVFLEYLREVAGPAMTDAYTALALQRPAVSFDGVHSDQRVRRRLPKDLGTVNSGTLDVATALLPGLMYERMQELGIDFSIIYPSLGLGLLSVTQSDLRCALARAYNTMAADIYAPFRDRFSPVAIIPINSPTEAIAELEHAVTKLGLKSFMMFGALPRPVPASGRDFDGAFSKSFWEVPYYIDTIGLDNAEDYDPFWRKCVELKVAVTSHAGATNWADRRSTSNNMFNHIGHFAQANHAFAKGVFFGGVTRRFPDLNFAFMEGGVAYGISLLWDILGHFEKFNVPSLLENYNPAKTDFKRIEALLTQYGSKITRAKVNDIMSAFKREPLQPLNYFERAGVNSEEDIVELYSKNFYFGCEADDPATAWAFDAERGAKLKTIFSSDLSHPDVPVMTHVIPEVYELLEHEILSEEDFKAFVFGNGIHLHGGMNADFFKGTVVEKAAAEELLRGRTR